MIRLEGDTLPLESQGAVPPILFGDLLRDVPGIPVQVGWAATLADNCGIDVSVTTLRLGGADLAEVLEAVPRAGVVQIGNEWLRYGAILGAPPRLQIAERGYRETEPAAHAKGAVVYFVETRPIYVLAYVPPGCSYPDDALVQLRVNDHAETPPATVRLQDTRLVPGVRLVTVEFDASRAFYTPPAPSLPSKVVVLGGGDTGTYTLRMGRAGGGAPGHVTGAPGQVVGGRSRRGGQADPRVRLLAPPPPTMRRGPATGTAPFAPPTRSRVSLRGALGQVTADLRGLRDTAAGRYSGVPLGPLVQPAAIVRLLLEETYGETDPARYHAPTWAATAARHAQRGVTWRLVWVGEAFEAFRDAAQVCGQADLYLDDEGRWRYAFRDPLTGAVGTLTPRELLEEPALSWTPGRDVVTELEVAWGEGVQGGTLTLESPHMIARYDRNHGGLALPYAATEGIARQLGRYQLARRDRPRQSCTVRASHAWLGLAVTDRIFVDTPLLRLYGATRVPFEIVGITDRGDERVLALLEGDPLARELPLAGTLTTGGLLELALTGTLDTEVLAQVLALAGTLVMPRSLSRALAGTVFTVTPVVGSLPLAGTLGAGAVQTVPLAGTLIAPAPPVSLPLAGSLESAVTLAWDADGATWDAAGATWDGPAGPAATPTVGNVETYGEYTPSGGNVWNKAITTGAAVNYLLFVAGTTSFGPSFTNDLTAIAAVPTGGGTTLTLTPLLAKLGSSGNFLYVYGAPCLPSQAYTVNATFSGHPDVAGLLIGLEGVAAVGTAATVTGGGTPKSVSVDTGGGEALILSVWRETAAATITPAAGQTEITHLDFDGQVECGADQKTATGAAVPMEVAIASGSGGLCYAAIPFTG